MKDEKQLLDIFKLFSDTIKDLNIPLNNLSQMLSTLYNRLDSIPKKEDLQNIIKILEQSIKIDLAEKIKILEICLHDNNKEILEKLNDLNNKSTLKDILESDIKKKQLETEQKIIESNNTTTVANKELKFKKLKKILGFIIIAGAGIVSFIKYVIPFIIYFWKSASQ